MPVPVAVRSKAQVCGSSPAEIVGSNTAGGHRCCEYWLLSGRGLCDELITRTEESYRLVRRWVWSRNLVNEEALAHLGGGGGGGFRAPKQTNKQTIW